MKNVAIKLVTPQQWCKIRNMFRENGVYMPRVLRIDWNLDLYAVVLNDKFYLETKEFAKLNKCKVIIPKKRKPKENQSVNMDNYPLLKEYCPTIQDFFTLINRKSNTQSYRFRYLEDYMNGMENLLKISNRNIK